MMMMTMILVVASVAAVEIMMMLQKSSRLFAGSLLYLRPNTSKYLEILIAVSLYFIRSEYPDSLDLDDNDIDGNTEVQMTSTDVLTSAIWQLVEVVRENAVGIGPFINDLFTRCKVQKALLHCLLSTLYERTGCSLPTSSDKHDVLPPRVSKSAKPSQLRAFQVKLLKLLQAIFVLEDNIEAVDPGTVDHQRSLSKTESDGSLQNNTYRYQPGKTLAFQSMLLSAVMHGLQNDDYDLHHEWLRFVIACLPHMKAALGTWVVLVVQQVGHMLQAQTSLYVPVTKNESGTVPPSSTR
ncbi:hypothetical protein QZH41_003796 [Actinostola sp. cb2023]|nr:hypothetical protein QZH41_003796 [Actinostola sp. cb2023]